MLIRNAEIAPGQLADVAITDGVITAIAPVLPVAPNQTVINAGGQALLPGLHDHHLHLRALAAAQISVRCGPPQVRDATELAACLRAADQQMESGQWLRGIGYHESVLGQQTLDRDWLDAVLPDRPLRIQHRSGRLWVFNSAALALIAPQFGPPLERVRGRYTGRLYDADDWLRERMAGLPPSLRAVSRYLASRGVTGVTDTTHHNGPDAMAAFAESQRLQALLQGVRVMGDARLDAVGDLDGVQRGEHKFHLHEHALPELDGLVATIRRSHTAGRATAFHCVTRVELVFALTALREAGSLSGDRIEHAAVTPPELMDAIAELGLTVVTQPNFIAERGDDYLRDVDASDRPWLYRLRGFAEAGIALAGSTDAPFGEPNPWAAMLAAVTRRTPANQTVGADEALSPRAALDLFLAPLESPGGAPRRLAVGMSADLCLLDRTWSSALAALGDVGVRRTLRNGITLYSVDD